MIGSRTRLFRAALVPLLFLVSCQTGARTSPAPHLSGGTLRVGVLTSGGQGCSFVFCGGDTDDPQISPWPLSFEVERCCLLRTLLSYNGLSTAEGGSVARPDLAASVPSVSPDGLTWTFAIKPGIRYGPPLENVTVTAQDFIRSIERLLSPTPGWLPDGWQPFLDSYTGNYLNLAGVIEGAKAYADGKAEHIAGLEAPNEDTLVLHLTHASGNLGYLLSLPDTAPIPPSPTDPEAPFGVAQGLERVYFSHLVSTGPYMIEGAPELDFSKPPGEQLPASGDGADSLTLVRNPSWDPSTDDLREAAPDRIELVPVKDPAAAKHLIGSGAIDIALNWNAPPTAVQGTDAVSALDSQNFLDLNPATAPFDDVHVRRAVNYAIARKRLAEIWTRHGQPATVMTHDGLDSEENNLLLNFDPYHAATGDLAAARREMAASSYDRNHDGRCDDKACKNIALWVNRDAPEQIAAGPKIAADLSSIGIKVHTYLPSHAQFGRAYGDPSLRVPLRIDGWYKDLPSGTTYFGPQFGSSRLGINTGVNQTRLGATPKELRGWGYKITHVQSVDARIRTCLPLTFSEQIRCWADLDQYLTTQVVPWVPLVNLVGARLTSDRVTNVSFDQGPPEPLPSLDRVTLQDGTQPSALPTPALHAASIPNGVYRFTVSRSDLLRFDPQHDSNIAENTGTTTAYLRDGRFIFVQRADHGIDHPISTGTYQGAGDKVTFQTVQPTFNAFTAPKASWSLDGQALHFHLLGCGDLNHIDPSGHFCKDVRAVYEGHPWVKVMDLP
jgi:peptide/nickel transport system substrate-binding protein